MQNRPSAKTLQVLAIVNLALLALLLLFGVAFETKGLGASDLSPAGVIKTLHTAGGSSFIHIIIGLLVGLFALLNMVLSLRSGIRNVRIFGTLAFLSILVAGSLGLVFILSGFQNQSLLFGLVPLFVLAVLSFLLELVSLRAVLRPRST